MKKIYLLAIIISLIAPLQSFASFTDVTEENTYYEAINYLETNGSISTGEKFNPDTSIKRCEFFKILLSDAGFKPGDASGENHFTDITGDEWFAPYANKAAELGLIKITSTNKTFNPGKEMTKGEAAKLMVVWGGFAVPMYLSEEDMSTSYRDLTYKNIYAPYIEIAISLGLINANDENYFGTQNRITRGEVANAIYKLDSYLATDEYVDYLTYNNIDISNIPYIDILSDVYTKLTNNYYGGVEEEELMYGAIKGMVDTIDDPHTIFSEPVEAESLTTTLSGKFVGIGAYLNLEENGDIIITGTISGSPAEQEGLQTNDIIMAVNGTSITDMSVEAVSGIIRGEAGTDVVLTIKRGEESFDVTLTRQEIVVTYVSTEILENDILYCSLDYFAETSATDFENAIDAELAEHKNIKGLIIDLRNNPGGYLEVATAMMSHFIEKDNYEVTIKYNNANTTYISEGPADYAKYPTAILVNGNSASASEIMASVLQEYGLAEIIGTQSYGKGTVQELYYYYDGSSLKYTVAHWLTPNGVDINGVGITPDVIIEDNPETTTDEQLEEALDTVEGMMD